MSEIARQFAYRDAIYSFPSGSMAALDVVQTFTASQSFTASAAASIPVTINGTTSQSGNLLNVKNVGGTIIADIDANGYLGIGTGATALGAAVDVQISSSSIFTARFRNDVNANTDAVIRFVKTRNSAGVSSGDKIGSFGFMFHDSNAIRMMGGFGARSSGAPANNNSPMQMWFGVTPGWNSTDIYGDATGQIIIDGPSSCTTIGQNIGTGGTTAQTGAVLGIINNTTTKKVLLLKAKASQSAKILDVQDSSANSLVAIGSAGGLQIKTGSNQRMGTATLVAGTVTVNNTSITANTLIFLSRTTTGGTVGHLSTTLVASTSFTINSSSATDTSVVAWLLVEPL